MRCHSAGESSQWPGICEESKASWPVSSVSRSLLPRFSGNAALPAFALLGFWDRYQVLVYQLSLLPATINIQFINS